MPSPQGRRYLIFCAGAGTFERFFKSHSTFDVRGQAEERQSGPPSTANLDNGLSFIGPTGLRSADEKDGCWSGRNRWFNLLREAGRKADVNGVIAAALSAEEVLDVGF
jgi:hypothetical protein